MATEEPAYESLEKTGDVELRRYAPTIVAETLVDGPLDTASSTGFRRIAAFIFGDNLRGEDAPGETIAMTAPVTMQADGETIDMTVPVTIEQGAGRWRMNFVMPSRYTMDTLPTPTDPRVTLREVPARTTAALAFSGLAREAQVAKRTQALLSWLAARGLEAASVPRLARYNPPWTPPFMRRNEILVDYRAGKPLRRPPGRRGAQVTGTTE